MKAIRYSQYGSPDVLELVTLDDLDQELPIAFSPDGGELVTYGLNNTIRLWDLRLIRQELAEMGLDWPAPPIPAGRKRR